MNQIISVELLRFRYRRLVRLVAVLVLAGIGVAGVITFAVSNRDIAGATARAREVARAEYEECRRSVSIPRGRDGSADECLSEPTSAEVDPRFHLSAFVDVARNLAPLAAALAMILGASYVGADWHHRVITTTLTWQPHRARLLLAKVTVAAGVSALGTGVALVLLGLALTPAALVRGTTAGVNGAWIADVGGVLAGVVVLSGVSAAFGSAAAMIGRNTAAAVGALFVWFAIVENLVRGLRPSWRGYLIGENAGLLVGVPDIGIDRSAASGGLALLFYTALIVAAASAAFRRDVA